MVIPDKDTHPLTPLQHPREREQAWSWMEARQADPRPPLTEV